MLVLLLAQWASASASTAIRTSSIAMTGKELAVVANQYSNSVTFMQVSDVVQPIVEIVVGVSPQTVAFDSDRSVVWVSNQGENKISVLTVPDASSGDAPQLLGAIDTRDAPYGVLIGSKFAYVSAQQADRVQVFDKYNYTLLAEVEVAASPRGMTLSNDERWLYVSHFQSGHVSRIDTSTFAVAAEISLGARAGLVQSITLNEEKQVAYVPNTIRNTDSASLEFDTSIFPFVSIVDLQSETHLRRQRIALDIIDRPVGLPLESILFESQLVVVNAASNDLTVIDIANMRLQAHIEVGNFPLGIVRAQDGAHFYVDNTVDGTVSVIDSANLIEIERTEVTQLPFDDNVKEGLRLFHSSDDTRMARDQWISCATCHFGGGTDNQVWHFPDGLRNTPSLLTTSLTGPFHWSGNLDEVQDVENTIRDLQGGTGLVSGDDNCTPTCDGAKKNSGRSDALDNLSHFMSTLRLGLSATQPDTLQKSMQRGEAFFGTGQLNCVSCHAPPLYTDNLIHDVQLAAGETVRINTPTLIDLTQTAPYYHDGRFSTLEQVLAAHPHDIEGQDPIDLDEEAFSDLLLYLKNLKGPDTLQRKPNLARIGRPMSEEPPEVLSMLALETSIVLSQHSGSQENLELVRSEMSVSFTHSSNASFDTYLVIEQLSTGEYWIFDSSWQFSKLEMGSTFAPFLTHREASDAHVHKLPTLDLYSSPDTSEAFVLHAVTTGSGNSVYEPGNWLSYDSTRLVF